MVSKAAWAKKAEGSKKEKWIVDSDSSHFIRKKAFCTQEKRMLYIFIHEYLVIFMCIHDYSVKLSLLRCMCAIPYDLWSVTDSDMLRSVRKCSQEWSGWDRILFYAVNIYHNTYKNFI